MSKRSYTQRTMTQNASAEGLTAVQHNALDILCKYRHDFHSNPKAVTGGFENGRKLLHFFYKTMPIMLRSTNLPGLDVSRELDALAATLAGKGEHTETMQNALMETINMKVEDYLRKIDYQVGTNYAPSGIARLRMGAEDFGFRNMAA